MSPTLTARRSQERSEQRHTVRRLPLTTCVVIGLAVLALLMVVSASVGPLRFPLSEVMHIVGSQLGLGDGADLSQRDVSVVWQLRVPRVLMGVLVGAALAISGAALQSLFNNPLADPGIIGVSGGASAGAVGVIVLAGSSITWLLPIGAFLAGLAVTGLIYVLARPGRNTGTSRMLLVGIAVGSGCQALTGFFTFIADDAALQTLTFWQMGSLGKVVWPQFFATLPIFIIGVIIVLLNARVLDVLTLGEREAQHLGLNVKRSRLIIVIATALLTGAAVAFAGAIGFVGLVVPHIVRIIVGPGHRGLLPISAIVGAILIVAADCASRVVAPPSEVPIGLFTAAVGAPFFLFLVVRMKKSSW
ncbi:MULTISPECIES: iron ABC transporter permease [unclassified Brevibacterium]|uniref:FecCD family ABC transporter permease n=1 Tax=unclassified Brevibacterium TaxID=2614124 RepID=UPI001E41DB12|nr:MULTISPECIES: iron ABC transporter permease [unclassified Brevibacterium]MDK8433982.1 iron ABC transporter permease [Brevibacterium sp. H-BE7]